MITWLKSQGFRVKNNMAAYLNTSDTWAGTYRQIGLKTLWGDKMAKGTTARQRNKKKSYSTSKNFTKCTPGSPASSDVSPNTENLHNQSLWRYFVFVILLSVGSVSLFCLKDTEFVSRTWRSIQVSHAFYSSTDQNDEQLPCNFGDNFTVDRRSNLSLEEFIRCYDAKRYLPYG